MGRLLHEDRQSSARLQEVNNAVRAAEAAAAGKALEEGRRAEKVQAELHLQLGDATERLEAAKKRYTSLSEKFAQREDVIVELRARMDEYERGVHGLREEVQEKQKMKELYEQRSQEVRHSTTQPAQPPAPDVQMQRPLTCTLSGCAHDAHR